MPLKFRWKNLRDGFGPIVSWPGAGCAGDEARSVRRQKADEDLFDHPALADDGLGQFASILARPRDGAARRPRVQLMIGYKVSGKKRWFD